MEEGRREGVMSADGVKSVLKKELFGLVLVLYSFAQMMIRLVKDSTRTIKDKIF